MEEIKQIINAKKEYHKKYQEEYRKNNKEKLDAINNKQKEDRLKAKQERERLKIIRIAEEKNQKDIEKQRKKQENALKRKEKEHQRYLVRKNRELLGKTVQNEKAKTVTIGTNTENIENENPTTVTVGTNTENEKPNTVTGTNTENEDENEDEDSTKEFLELFIDKVNFEDLDKEVDEYLLYLKNTPKKTEDMKEYMREYYKNNKEKIRKNKEKYNRGKRDRIIEDPEKFKNGKVYRLVHNNKMIYIGSTTNTLEVRFDYHKKSSEDINYNSNLYKYIRENGIDNISIELIENYICNSRDELNAKEAEYIEKNFDQILNQNIPLNYL